MHDNCSEIFPAAPQNNWGGCLIKEGQGAGTFLNVLGDFNVRGREPVTDKEKQGSWEPQITGFYDFGSSLTHACTSSIAPGTDLTGVARNEEMTDRCTHRRLGSGGLCSLLETDSWKPGVFIT